MTVDFTAMQAQLEFGWFLPERLAIRPAMEANSSNPRPRNTGCRGSQFRAFPRPGCCHVLGSLNQQCHAVAKAHPIKALVAARPGYVIPVQPSKMGATFDQLAVNLIAGQSELKRQMPRASLWPRKIDMR